MRRLGTLIIALGLAANSFACLNIYYDTDLHGHLHEVDESSIRYPIGFNKKKLYERLQELKAALDTSPSMELLSDYAVTLLKLGKTGEALTLLQGLQQAHPKEYQLASNLGTAYELTGELDSALKYIRIGMQLNPKAHEGSEWVHIAVLETKKKLQEDPDYLSSHTVLELDAAREADTTTLQHISIQLKERMPFMPNKDAIMASLFEDLGDCYANTSSVEMAKAHYELAINYYGAERSGLSKKINSALRARHERRKKYGPEGRLIDRSYIADSAHRKHGKEANPLTIGGIPYKELLKWVEEKDYEPNWKEELLQTSTLLALLELKPLSTEQSNPKDDQSVPLVEPLNDGEKDPVWMYAFIVIATTGIAYAIYRSRKRRS